MQTAAVVRAVFVKTVKKADPRRLSISSNKNIEIAPPTTSINKEALQTEQSDKDVGEEDGPPDTDRQLNSKI